MIAFVNLIDPGLDYDLLPFWVAHYANAQIDRFVMFLHRKPRENDEECDQAASLFRNAGWEVSEAQGDFSCGALQKTCIDRIRDTLGPDDIVVTADSDEFHDLSDYRQRMESCDLITGTLIDRWDSTLHKALAGTPLSVQYPLRGDIYQACVRHYDLDPSNPQWAVPVNQTKVLAYRNRVPVRAQGSHNHPSLRESFKEEGGHAVEHYSWRTGFAGRMAQKGYFPPMFVMALLGMFNVKQTDKDWETFTKWHAQRQRERGWEPCWKAA